MNNLATAVKTKWNIDTTHSEIQFKVRHMMIAAVTGKFKQFDGQVETIGEHLENATISFSAKTASINTNVEDRDNHLRSADFFDSEKFPELSFVSTEVVGKYLKGNLTIKDVTRAVELKISDGGTGKDPWGNTRMGFSLNGKINRKDWGLNWNSTLETGGVLVSERVELICEVQLVKQ